MARQDLIDLIQRYLEIVYSPENEQKRSLWTRVDAWNRDFWRGVPARGPAVPYTVAPDNSIWAKILDLDLRNYYSDPEVYLEAQLRMKLYHHEHFDDDTCFTPELYLWFGVVTELSLFGLDLIFYPHKEAWIRAPLIAGPGDLERLELPDFYASGVMPRIHHYYEVLSEYSRGQLEVMFPEWVRGPFCIATHLRGMENLLMDLILNPELVHRLMRFVVDANKQWHRERERFLGRRLGSCKLFNDEIGIPALSPAHYDSFVYPYEKELAEHYGGVSYWHSCADTTAFIERINTLGNLRMFHCGPETSLEAACAVLDDATALDVCVSPHRDVIEADESHIRKQLERIMTICSGRAYAVRADGIMPEGDLDVILESIRRFSRIARELLQRAPE
jgi:uroporphyrinogen-III decarboxylase